MNIRQIVASHLIPIADAITADILASFTAAAPKGPKPKAKPAKKASKKPAKKPKAKKTPRAPKAPSAATEANALKVAEHVASHPEGVAAKDILEATGLGKAEWPKAAKAAVLGGAVRVEGQKRAAKYFPTAATA